MLFFKKKKSIDERVRIITERLKKKYTEASLDLYYDNYSKPAPYVAKAHSAIHTFSAFHGRAKDFHGALDAIEKWFDLPRTR